MSYNLILKTDSYKTSHWLQYPPGTEVVYSYLESRGGEFDHTVFFGLQYLIKKHLLGEAIRPVMVDKAEELINKHMGPGVFNRAGWDRLIEKHQGRLPIRIKAVPEGTIVPTGNVLMTIENTDPEFYWLTNYLETLLLHVWYPTTVATLSKQCKNVIGYYLQKTGDVAGLPFKLHDFGYRGVSSDESAAIGGAAHLVNFQGTDTLAALPLLEHYYNASGVEQFIAGFSIPATEHSTMTSWLEEGELDALENHLDNNPDRLIACVIDSYNYKNFILQKAALLKDKILSRPAGAGLVFRPDSGDPRLVVVEVLNMLGEVFGYELNSKGYKVLPPQVRVIQGDGLDLDMIGCILNDMMEFGWSADNIAFGMGGGLLQQVNRDTCKFAFKCSWARIEGQGRNVFKQPVGAEWKKSKKGRLKLIQIGEDWDRSYATVAFEAEGRDMLRTVYENGKLLIDQPLELIRRRAEGEQND